MAQSADDQELMELSRSSHVSGYAADVPTGAAAADPDVISTWQQRRAAQREAYGQYVALDMIHIAGVPVFAPGQQVPLEHVIRFGLFDQELVAKVATPEQARAGKTFESDDDFTKANPHVARRGPSIPEAHPAALDPRGAGAEHDPEGKHLSKPAKAEMQDQEPIAKVDEKAEPEKPAAKSTAKSAASGKDA
jgi:hypothetical protein